MYNDLHSLEALLEYFSRKYYEGNPVITDSEYDALVEKYPEADSVGFRPSDGIPHLYPMYSLKKYYVGEDSPPDYFSSQEVIKTPKLDGSALALVYFNGKLVRVLTRGNGTLGEDITHLFCEESSAMLGIPYTIDTGIHDPIQIVGELVAAKDTPNGRNVAAGASRLKSISEFKDKIQEYNLTFFCYDWSNKTETYKSDLIALENLGFTSVLSTHSDLPTDGEVYRINNNKEFDRLGYTSKFPRGAYALKERSEGIETVLLDVIWQAGKTGAITPVAILDPVEIDGAKVSKATLNNPAFIEAMDLEIGCGVKVERAGGIIPRVIEKCD